MRSGNYENQCYRRRIPVPDLDNERFETYLKQFRPLTPDALPVSEIRAVPRSHLNLTIWAVAGVVVMVILGVSSLRVLNHLATGDSKQSAVKLPAPTPPLTVRGANALLAAAPSYKALMNELAFRAKTSTVPKHTQSALAVLGKEKIKL
jgi:hypothetical protein